MISFETLLQFLPIFSLKQEPSLLLRVKRHIDIFKVKESENSNLGKGDV